ncbi:hypothetical protein P167DRAFT_545614 [Morchella conica CCBAS932]|uniref:Uncharacterized protein n=1 Tax=Morchella conica CCBAS932 TaxID=1392247 RepID=A0A3N4L306_9PEZI|nr:hypothetical protein P167DRAFT_545614 [Morchella conica CCBAS932]
MKLLLPFSVAILSLTLGVSAALFIRLVIIETDDISPPISPNLMNSDETQFGKHCARHGDECKTSKDCCDRRICYAPFPFRFWWQRHMTKFAAYMYGPAPGYHRGLGNRKLIQCPVSSSEDGVDLRLCKEQVESSMTEPVSVPIAPAK